jgi:hypothetical protein
MCEIPRQDDTSIVDEDRLFRRIHPAHVVKDDDTGLARVSTAAFKDQELSINIESVLRSEGKTAEVCLQNYPKYKLVAITAGEARQYQQIVCRDPLPENLSHGLVCGSKKSNRIHNGLRALAKWVVPAQPPLFVDIPK